MTSRRVVPCLVLGALLAVGSDAEAQTPEQQRQMEYERQQREYWRAQEAQRQEQQRQQQIMNENARRQQEEQSRINRPAGGGSAPGNVGGAAGAGGGGSGSGASRQQIEAELDRQRAEWSKRPALPPDRNPLLGRWMRPASTRGNSNDPFAQLATLAKGGMCELFFGGGGVFEFRPGSLVGSDAHSPPKELDQVEYRGGDGKRVIVIPKASFKLIDFHFDGPDRVTWPLHNCTLVRVGGAQANNAAAAPVATAGAAAGSGAAAATGSGVGSAVASTTSGAVLSVAVSVGSGAAVTPHAGAVLYVLRHDAEQTLRRGGLQPRPGQSILKTWSLECRQRSQVCSQGAQLLGADSLGYLRTDAQGKVQSPPIAPGTYYVFTSKRLGEDELFWNQRVELKTGVNAVTLDQRNAFVPQ